MEDANAENAWKDFSFVEVRFCAFVLLFRSGISGGSAYLKCRARGVGLP
jgi:hypothetical protein